MTTSCAAIGYTVAMPSRRRRLALLAVMSVIALIAAQWVPRAGSFWAIAGLAFWAGIAALWSP
jgi:hypothetical protein